MIDDTSDTAPLPALPLDYASGDSESIRSILRLVAWLFVLWQISHLVSFVTDSGCYFWEQGDRTISRKLLRGVPLIIKLPQAVVSFYLVVNSATMVGLSQSAAGGFDSELWRRE